jgi:hypothetical protein
MKEEPQCLLSCTQLGGPRWEKRPTAGQGKKKKKKKEERKPTNAKLQSGTPTNSQTPPNLRHTSNKTTQVLMKKIEKNLNYP